ncbi:hypothetical protein HYQ46_006441 [Verticillium longisporum]|nr:hypothetical protein HYQ46_006441 [Verticillium longisporum]
MLGFRIDSSCRWTRAWMRSLENSRAPWVPAATGAVKRGQRMSQARRRAGRVREAETARASWTAAQKRGQRNFMSSSVVLGTGAGMEGAMILT